MIRETAVRVTGAGNDANAVLSFPVLVLGGLILVRIGQLLRSHGKNAVALGGQATFRDRLVNIVGRGAIVIGLVGPVLGAVGYVTAAGALVYPAAMSLGLLGVIFVLQDLVDNLYALIVRQEERLTDALAPTLIGFALTLASLPLFALIWGARTSDISELWQKFLSGFAIGETQISPRAFLIFVLIFAIGYMLTRLIQGALRSSILPKTRLDQGGQNAILAGLGYLGHLPVRAGRDQLGRDRPVGPRHRRRCSVGRHRFWPAEHRVELRLGHHPADRASGVARATGSRSAACRARSRRSRSAPPASRPSTGPM